MQIRHMSATFGKLPQKQLTLQPGLNIIHTLTEQPSAWCQFLQTMFYGLPETSVLRDRSPLSGTLALKRQHQHYIISRSNVQPGVPSGDFSCLDADASIPASGITAQNCGEVLLGIPRVAFPHAALIGAATMPPDADPAHWFRALVPGHNEESSILSAPQTQERYVTVLKENLVQLNQALEQYDALHTQYDAAKTYVRQTTQQTEDLQQALAQYQALDLQEAVRQCRQAKEQATALYQHFLHLEARDPHLPTMEELQQLSAMAHILEHQLQEADAANADACRHRQESEAAQEAWCAHPFYPTSEESLTGRQQAAPKSAALSPLSVVLSLLAGAAAGVAAWSSFSQMVTAVGTGAGISFLLLIIWYCLRRRRCTAKRQRHTQQQQEVQTYLELLHRADTCAQQAQRSAANALQLHRRCQESLLLLLSRVQPFRPQAMDLTSSRAALHSAMQARQAVEHARQAAQNAAMWAQQLEAQLPQGPLPQWDAKLPHPVISRTQVENALALALSRQKAARQQETQLAEQLRALCDRQTIQRRRDATQAEYLYLQQHNPTPNCQPAHLPPVVIASTASVFSQLTGQNCPPALMEQLFSVLFHGSSEKARQLPEQSVLAPLALALRLAVCDLLLPQEPAVPLILDDVLRCLDDAHAAMALDFLSRLSTRRQILLFTRQKHESPSLASQRNVTHLSL